jgi:hypothetical protein
MRTGQATLGRQHQRDLEHIQKLEHQFQAYHMHLQKSHDKIHRLTAERQQAMQDVPNLDPCQSLTERISLDVYQNHRHHPNVRQYSIDTLIWVQEIHTVSPAALDTFHRGLPFPDESLLNSRFACNHRFVSSAFQDDNKIGEGIELWE